MPLPAVPENTYRPTLTASVRDQRRFGRLYPQYPYEWRTEIEVVNASAADITYRDSRGAEEVIPAGATKRYKGTIYYYSLEADETTNADEVTIYERGGLTRAD